MPRFSNVIAYKKPIDVISAKSPRLSRIGQILHQHRVVITVNYLIDSSIMMLDGMSLQLRIISRTLFIECKRW